MQSTPQEDTQQCQGNLPFLGRPPLSDSAEPEKESQKARAENMQDLLGEIQGGEAEKYCASSFPRTH